MPSRRVSPLDTAVPIADAIATALTEHDASVFAHVGSEYDPSVQYLRRALEAGKRSPRSAVHSEADRQRDPTTGNTYALAFDGTNWYHRIAESDEPSPADALATDLLDAELDGTVLTPARVPHDAALYLDASGFELVSTDVLARSRASKTVGERERIEYGTEAALAGFRAIATTLQAATVAGDGRYLHDAGGLHSPNNRTQSDDVDAMTTARLRTVVNRAIVEAGAVPTRTQETPAPDYALDEPLAAGDPIVISLAPRGPDGYHGYLVRTLVIAGEGGDERRAHVALTQAFRSVEALLSADRPVTVSAVEHDLEAEIRAFGFEEGIEADVTGIGLERRERPLADDEVIDVDAVVRIEAAVRSSAGTIRLADVATPGEGWLCEAPRSLDPAAVLD